jgi:hypothetical protein
MRARLSEQLHQGKQQSSPSCINTKQVQRSGRSPILERIAPSPEKEFKKVLTLEAGIQYQCGWL